MARKLDSRKDQKTAFITTAKEAEAYTDEKRWEARQKAAAKPVERGQK